MSLEWTEDDIRRYCARTGMPLPEGIAPAPAATQKAEKVNKYRNIKTEVDGEMFDSRREAHRWEQHKRLLAAGEELAVARQVKFHLPGGIIYIADFVTLMRDYRYQVEDAKGVRTKEYMLKRRLMRECLGIEIEEI